ncbi:MAG: flagellar brake protein [Phycisphaeraceae bacterium]
MPSRRLWQDMLADLAARNGSVELTPLTGATGDPSAEAGEQAGAIVSAAAPCRSRLLAVGEDGSLLVELPQTPEKAAALREAAEMEVLLASAGQRWVGRCRVLRAVRHQLNRRTTVVALRLGKAAQVRSAQRRRFYRVSTAGLAMEPLWLWPRTDANEPRPPAVKARLVNLSGSGMGLRLEHPHTTAGDAWHGQVYHCRLCLPGEDEPVTVDAQVVHVEPADHDTLQLGLAFAFAGDAEQRRVQDQIVRFTTELERQRLRRQRRA